MGGVFIIVFISALVAIYLAFLAWYGGRGKPLTEAEVEAYLAALKPYAQGAEGEELLAGVRTLVARDDGREFIMQNLVRYRPKALYPPGHHHDDPRDDDPRAADRRYGRGIVPHLLRYGSLPLFIARRSGSFIEPEGADQWHYVAMVRYRSRRDFLRFALAIEQAGVAVHKWAALEKTHVFPVRPMLSLFFVRGCVAALLATLGALLYLGVR